MDEHPQSAPAERQEDVQQITRAEGELQALDALLEQRVAERTADLEKTIADLRQAREAAEQANRAKTEFLSRISHELRTPLNAMLGFAQIMRLRGAALPTGERDEYVGQIEKAGWHLLELINDLLDLSRIEAGKMRLTSEPVAVKPLCAECVEMLKPLASAAAIEVVDLTRDAEPLFVLGDRTRLSQILMNLLSNAVKYNHRGGSITLTLQAAGNDCVEIGVADTGPGFSAEQLRNLYEPFNRLGAELAPVEGAGIGLVISKRLAEVMGGTIELATQQGAGSEFTLRLARAEPAGAAALMLPEQVPIECADARNEARKVLYIEDNPSNIELVESILALRPGVELVSAPDGPTGLGIAEGMHPDLILIDIGLPGIDGFEVCRRFRRRSDTSATPIMAISANAMQTDIARGRSAGFDDYLTKPLDVRQMLSHIDRMLDSARA